MIPLFSVIIPTHNRKAMLARCLDALAAQEGGVADCEVIVVDDGSTDGTGETFGGRRYPFAFTCCSMPNAGPGCARNAGAARASGTYLAFTEDDVVPGSDWLASARRRLADGDVDVLEGRTVREGDRADIRRFEPEPSPSFIPCNLFVRRTVFDRLGGYDEAFFDRKSGLYFREDADLGFRLLTAGYVAVLADDVVVEHPLQFPDLASSLRHVRRYQFDPLLYRKHPGLYRSMIEVKSIGGMVVHRPLHYACLMYAALVAVGVAGAILALPWVVPAALCGLFTCSWLVRFKYQSARALRLYRPGETAGFAVLPAVYLASVVKGCFRFRSFGALV
jgi:glycosyltransferase involved in cell wall biosynthesis